MTFRQLATDCTHGVLHEKFSGNKASFNEHFLVVAAIVFVFVIVVIAAVVAIFLFVVVDVVVLSLTRKRFLRR